MQRQQKIMTKNGLAGMLLKIKKFGSFNLN